MVRTIISDAELDEMLELTKEEQVLFKESAGEVTDVSESKDEEKKEGEEKKEDEKSLDDAGKDKGSGEEKEASDDEKVSDDDERSVDSADDEKATAKSDSERNDESAAARRENEGLKRELFRERERRRVAETMVKTMRGPEKIKVPSEAVETDDDGDFIIDRDKLAKKEDVSGLTDQEKFARHYNTMRSDVLEKTARADLEDMGSAVSHLESAYFWLDKELSTTAKEIGIGPEHLASIGAIRRVMDAEGLTEKFKEEYPELRVEDLVLSALDPYLFETTARSYMESKRAAKSKESGEHDEEDRKSEDNKRTLKLAERPRSMSSRGTGSNAGKKTAKDFADISSEDLFDMSDSDFREMEAAAKT